MPVSRQQIEHVLVVPTLLFQEIGYFQGFNPNPERYLKTLLDPAYTSYRPTGRSRGRPRATSSSIPYCIFRYSGRVFHYKRGKLQGEGRLHSKRSIGIGGHISSQDQSEHGSAYLEAMQREIEEEVYLESPFTARCVGLINDDQTEVGRVHLGIVHVFDLEAPKVRPREKSIQETGFASPAELCRRSRAVRNLVADLPGPSLRPDARRDKGVSRNESLTLRGWIVTGALRGRAC